MRNQDISYTDFKLFLDCALCFYLKKRKYLRYPNSYKPGVLKHIEQQLKKEVSSLRREKRVHGRIRKAIARYGCDLEVYNTSESRGWRDINDTGKFKGGISYNDRDSGIKFYGEIDDVLKEKCSGKLVLIDYKLCDADGLKKNTIQQNYDRYRNQISFYAWLLQRLGHNIASYGYIIFCSTKSREHPFIAFSERVSFAMTAYRIELNISLIEHEIIRIDQVLKSSIPPESSGNCCQYCRYFQQRKGILL